MRVAERISNLKKILLSKRNIIQKFTEVSFRKFSIKSLHKRNSFFPRYMMITDFLRSILRRPAVAEFNKHRIIQKPICFIINAVVFGICPLCPYRVCFKPSIFYGVIITLLRNPFKIITEIMKFNIFWNMGCLMMLFLIMTIYPKLKICPGHFNHNFPYTLLTSGLN